MILSFKKRFNPKILNGSKIHTIREDKSKRWSEGREIQFANGIRTKNYNQFHTGVCMGVQDIAIVPKLGAVRVVEDHRPGYMGIVQVDPKVIALNDGFESEAEFWEWFKKPFIGKLIHWTDFRYEKNNR